jgi:hypothetical protein
MGSTFNGLVGLIILALDIWAIINVLKSGAQTGMKIVWILLILLLPVLGLIIWAEGHRAPIAPINNRSSCRAARGCVNGRRTFIRIGKIAGGRCATQRSLR